MAQDPDLFRINQEELYSNHFGIYPLAPFWNCGTVLGSELAAGLLLILEDRTKHPSEGLAYWKV
jgi:hypothetical protein